MKKTLGVLFCFLLMSSCSNSPSRSIGSIDEGHELYDEYVEYEEIFQKFHVEVDKSLDLRKRAVAFYVSEKREGKKQYFDSKDLELIRESVKEYVENRKQLLGVAHEYRDLVSKFEIEFTTERPSGLEKVDGWFFDMFGSRKILYVNPTDEMGALYIKKIQISLAAALTLYDNYIIAIMPYHDKGDFRRAVDGDNLETKNIIKKISGNFRKLDNYKDTLEAVEFMDKLRAWEAIEGNKVADETQDAEYFQLLISGSYTNKRIRDINVKDRIAFRTKRFRRILRDFFVKASQTTMNSVSKVFGNSVGLIQSRQGYMKKISRSHQLEMHRAMKPGDILLEKTPFRLTDKFIPGHWGHVAIWTGSQSELKELGVWDELPALYEDAKRLHNYKGPSFQDAIRKGKRIIEALRPGVQLNSLSHFLNIDDFAALRDNSVSKENMKEYLLKGFAQIGKKYDFNFDVETDKKIVCSELAFVVYNDYEWPIEKKAGRYTISPDNVAVKSMGDGPFEPVLLYHDGKQYRENLQKNFNHLMKLEYDEARRDLVTIKRNY